MLPLICIIALCGLLSPSQGHHEEMAQMCICKGFIEKLLSGVMDASTLTACLPKDVLPLGSLLGSEKGILGGLFNTVTGTLGLQIKEASLANVEVRMHSHEIKLKITTVIKVTLDLSTATGVLNLLPIDVLNMVKGGKLDLSVKLVTAVPLKYSMGGEHNIELILDQNKCKALQLSIEIKGPKRGSGLLSTVTNALEKHLGGPLTDCLGNVLSPLICETVLPIVLGLVNDKLHLLGCGIFPLNVIGNTVEYVVAGIKAVGECLQINVNAALDGNLIEGDGGSNHIPPLDCDGIVVPLFMVQKICAAQLSQISINAMLLNLPENCLDADTVRDMIPEMVRPESLCMKTKAVGEPFITLGDGCVNAEILISLKAYGGDTTRTVFELELDLSMKGTPSFVSGNIEFQLRQESVANIRVVSSVCSISIENMLSFIEHCVGTTVVVAIASVEIRMPIPTFGPNPNHCHIDVNKNCFAITAKNGLGIPERPQMPGMPQLPGVFPLPA